MRNLKKTLKFALLLTLCLGLLVGCGGKTEGEEDYVEPGAEVSYTENELGFTITMSDKLFVISTFGEKEKSFDEELEMDRTTIQISGVIEEIKVPLVAVNVYQGEFTAADLETKNPLMVYAGAANGLTYTLRYSEEAGGVLTEEQLPAYNDIMNNYVAGMEKKMTFFKPGEAEGQEPSDPKSPLDQETLDRYLKEATPTDLKTYDD